LLEEKWKNIYKPQEYVKEEWYIGLEEEITESKWNQMLKELKTATTPGVSNISYIAIFCLKMGVRRHKRFSEIYVGVKERYQINGKSHNCM